MNWKLVATIVNFLAKNPCSPVWATEGLLIQVKGYLSDAFHSYSCNCPTEKSLYSAELCMKQYEITLSDWKYDMADLDHYRERIESGTDWVPERQLVDAFHRMRDVYAQKWGSK